MTPEEDILDSLRSEPMSILMLRRDTGRDRAELVQALEALATAGVICAQGWRWRLMPEGAPAGEPPRAGSKRHRALLALRKCTAPVKRDEIARAAGLTGRQALSALSDLRASGLAIVVGKRWLPSAAAAR